MIDREDIRAAVAAGALTEAQAASLIAFSQARQGARNDVDGLSEPFELFRGFNEIFIVVGLAVLFIGWTAFTGAGSAMIESSVPWGFGNLLAAGATVALSLYFTIKRRMVAPSIALVVMFATAIFFGLLGVTDQFNDSDFYIMATIAAATTAALLGHFIYFRVPITTALIAIGTFATLAITLVATGYMPLLGLGDLFSLSADGSAAWLTIAVGLGALGFAMWFDMSDPYRVSRRSSSGFWLHVVAAPALVNTLAVTLLEDYTALSLTMLVIILAIVSLFAIIIDRRSFLVAGIGYIVAVASIVLEDLGGVGITILVLGAGLVFLGAQWERIRAAIMRRLPNFPGKTKLPPYEATA